MERLMMSNRLFLLFVLAMGWLFFHPMAAQAEVWVVAAGISDYPGTVNDLRLPAKDAETIAQLYKRNCNAHAQLLLDDEATATNIVATMRTQYAKAKEDDIVVFFFSGHGSREGCFCAYDGYLEYEDVRDAMALSKSKNKMIFADACFAGKMRQDGHAMKPTDLNVMLFLSSRSDETSIERPSMKNGFFTACLDRCLRGAADVNKDRTITAKELFTAVQRGVVKLSKDKQHPVMWGNFDDDMPVMVW